MKRNRPYIFRCLLAVLAMLPLLCSCEHKELCYHHEHYAKLRLEFDWRDAPDAYPAGMSVFFYPEEPGREPIRFNFMGRDGGGEIEVPLGRYRLLCYNSDTSGVLFSGVDDIATHTAFTRRGSMLEPMGVQTKAESDWKLRAEGTENEPVVICPDMMWGCNAVDVEVSELGISYICVPESEKDEWIGRPPVTTEYVITLFPHELTCIYTYEIRHVKNLDVVSRMSASLSGMSPALRLFDEELDRQCVTHPFDAQVDTKTGNIVGRFITFGHHEENADPHKMMLYLLTKDGRALVFGTNDKAFDVTSQVHSAPNKRRVHLIIDGLDIPPVPTDPGGYIPGVDDWIEINNDIII